MITKKLTLLLPIPILILIFLLISAFNQAKAPQEIKPLPPNVFARIIFFGDSITRAGDLPKGYVSIVRDSLNKEYPNPSVEVIGSGVDGNKVPNLQARLKEDVIANSPTHVVIYIGVNDVWHFYDSRREPGTDRKVFEQGLRDLIKQIRESGSEVLLCTPGVVGEDPDSNTPVNQLLIEYAEISRTVAKTSGVHLCDLRSAFEKYLRTNNPNKADRGILTTDRVHLNGKGNRFVANFMLDHLRPLLNSQAKNKVNSEQK
jgi:lysophospholipase L1-like esterase